MRAQLARKMLTAPVHGFVRTYAVASVAGYAFAPCIATQGGPRITSARVYEVVQNAREKTINGAWNAIHKDE